MISERRKKALIEMAKRGTLEEQNIAEMIIRRSGISIEDEEKEKIEFKFSNKYEKRLLHQISGMVTNDPNVIYYTSNKKSKTIWIEVTKLQKIEIDLFYSIYRREIKEEMEITFAAFIQRNNIYPQKPMDNQEKPDIERIRKILNRADTIDKTHVRKQIGAFS